MGLALDFDLTKTPARLGQQRTGSPADRTLEDLTAGAFTLNQHYIYIDYIYIYNISIYLYIYMYIISPFQDG